MKKKWHQVSSGVKLSDYPALQKALTRLLKLSLPAPPTIMIVSLVPVCSSPNLDWVPSADDSNFLTLHLHVTTFLVPAYP